MIQTHDLDHQMLSVQSHSNLLPSFEQWHAKPRASNAVPHYECNTNSGPSISSNDRPVRLPLA